MYINSDNQVINLVIIGKPNSGKSTLFNKFLRKEISPTGGTYGLTKELFIEDFTFKNISFVIHDTPGLRRKSKISNKDEETRNKKVVKLLDRIDVAILLIDSTENLTKQDFKIADTIMRRKKLLFFVFNKIDLLDNKKEFKKKIKDFLNFRYSQSKEINVCFISALSGKNIVDLLDEMIIKNDLCSSKIKKNHLNNFIKKISKDSKLPKIKNIQVKPKYIVQIDSDIPKFKIFINSKKKAPNLFIRYFDNEFRKFFSLNGVPINMKFISSDNPYAD
tara:strand:+ start:1670 stop:2497 length:828 start_codon:yes stop_codon:yes gene_type:complete